MGSADVGSADVGNADVNNLGPEEKAGRMHKNPGPHDGAAEELSQGQPRSILPRASTVIQAGAFGATLGGVTAGVSEIARVKQGEITTDQAIENVVKSSAQGAATMAVATVAAQVVRSHPVFGFVALAAAGLGAFYVLSGAGKKRTAAGAVTAGDKADDPTTAGPVPPAAGAEPPAAGAEAAPGNGAA